MSASRTRHPRRIGATLAVLSALVVAVPGNHAAAAPFDADSINSPGAAGDSGHEVSVLLDDDGYPVILSSTDGPNLNDYELHLIRCTNAECSGAQTAVALDNLGTSFGSNALALASDGDPVVAWTDSTGDLRVIACSNSDCSGSQTANVINADFNEHVDMVLDASDRPVLAYHEAWGEDLAVVHCTTTDCSGAQTVNKPDTAGFVGDDPAIVLDAAGRPVVAYYDASSNDLNVVRCTTTDCSGAQTPVSTVTSGLVGYSPSLALDADGNPVVSYWNNTDDRLELLRCTTSDCSGAQTPQVVDGVGNPGYVSAVALDPLGNPVVAYLTIDDRDVRVAHCTTADCSATPLITTPEGADFIGYEIDMVLDDVGNPVVVYRNATVESQRLLRCTDVDGCGGRDQDSDLVTHSSDNCPTIANTDQTDVDGDDIGDACDPLIDTDDDTIADTTDNCPTTPNTNQTDTDNDGTGDACDPLIDTDDDTIADTTDNCPTTPNTNQTDTDNDDIGDACDPLIDTDDDTIADTTDNCPTTPNTNQTDTDNDGTGDACDEIDDRIPEACAHVVDPNVIVGTDGDDVITGTAGNDVILALGGDDSIRSRGGDDCIIAGAGDDRVRSGGGADLVHGGRGADTIRGGRGPDVLFGQRGPDRLHGGRHDDTLAGGPGRDMLRGGRGTDACTDRGSTTTC